ncbi:SusC/RagA family TonB-linked outer membrane protein [Portibacter marinus]|uniref:SusC/RagA family TonB-linked outer membrane protein n=1 Tax=Portibacter marinus TaxID=2898660 RepID=UPI001F483FFD|nr:SusC/RagA family TonB-linked outer membrane protein [Portibacter marinus]
MLKITQFTILFMLTCCILTAQQTVTGLVTGNDGLPLIGVNIFEKGTDNGTTTSIEGTYTIEVQNENAVLTYSYIGMQEVERIVGQKSNIDVIMSEDAKVLDEVVVTALGLEQDKDNLGYASSNVDGQSIVKSGEPTVLNSLAGKSSGVRITRNSGDPGAGSYIQIRGLSTITRDNQPLIVVDGIPISNDVRGNSDRGGVSQESRLNDINPNDIESISVLKGASAAALYGTQALGGVILITTKSGSFQSKTRVSLKSTYSLDVINRIYPLQTTYGQGDRGVWNQRARDSWGDKIADRSGGTDNFDTSGEYFVDQEGNIYYPIIDKTSQTIYDQSNFDQIFQNGQFLENNLSVNGGNKSTAVYFSLSDMNQQGIIRNNSDYRRTTSRMNVKHLFSDKVKLNVTSNYTRTASNRIQKGANSSGLYLGLLRTPPDFDNTGYRGEYFRNSDASPVPNRHRSYREPIAADGTPTYNNPSWTINEQENKAKVDRFISSAELTVSPTSWIDLIGRVGLDHYSEKRNEFFTPGSAAGAFNSGLYEQSIATNTVFNMDYIAKATRNLTNNLNATALVGFNYNQKSRNVNGVNTVNFIQFVDVASVVRDKDNALPENVTTASSQGQERTAGVYSSLSLDAFDMLFVNGTLRVESASTFGDAANNTFLFPSVSAAWHFNKLGSLQNDIFSFGKLRASYGEVGVQPARYNTSNVYVSPTFNDSFGGGLNLGLYGNGGFVPSAFRGNSSLLPERKKEFEVGTDLRFLKNRLSFSATYFDNVTEDVLLDFPVANSRGYSQIYANGAEIRNDGFELDLGYDIIRNQNMNWNLTATFTRVRNEVTDLNGIQSINLGGLAAVNSRAIEGQPLGVLWGSRTLRDENGAIVYDENGFPEQDELEGVIGDPNPDWQGSLISSFSYKNFTLSLLFETFQGADIFAGTKSVLTDLGRWKGTDNEITASRNLKEYNGNIIFIGETFRGNVQDFGAGPVALTESWYNGDGGFFSNGNDELFIEDGSWSRLREMSLSYRLNPGWTNSTLGKGGMELTLTGRNLLLWSPFEGNDPDTNLSGVSVARGIDYFNNPGTKSYVLSLLLDF